MKPHIALLFYFMSMCTKTGKVHFKVTRKQKMKINAIQEMKTQTLFPIYLDTYLGIHLQSLDG